MTWGNVAYGLQLLQGVYPSSISVWRNPVNSSLLEGDMDCTLSHSGRWNLWLLLFRMYVCCSAVLAEEDESPLVFASEEPDGVACASFPPAALLEVDDPLVPEAPASRLLGAY